MSIVTFTVRGDPVPHVAVTHRSRCHPDNKRAKKVAAYKEDVRKSAMAAHVTLPHTLTEMRVAIVRTTAYFRNRRHADPESVHKAIKDALWPAKQGGDKYTGGSYDPPLYDAQNPRVEVEVRF